MKRFEDFTDGLQQDLEIPDHVWSQYMYTLEHIGQSENAGSGSQNTNKSKRRKGYLMNNSKKQTQKAFVKAAAVAGVLIAGTLVFSYADPAAASRFPIIGNIFEQVSEDAVYSGNYEGKTVLKEEEQENTKDNGNKNTEENAGSETTEGIYTASDKGITITASEVYSDGYSVYLAAEIQSQEGGFSNIPAHYTRQFENKTSKSLYTLGMWKTDSDERKMDLDNQSFEGKSIDDHTFIGMMKLDRNQYLADNGQLQLELSEIYFDDETMWDTEEIEPQHRIQGTWKLRIPFTVDTKQSVEIPVNKKNEAGFNIKKVFVSANQVIVFTDTPYTTLSPETYTKEDFEKQWGEKNEEILAYGGEEITYEEMLERRYYDYYEVVVYDQNGEQLEMQYADETKTVFALQGHELSKLHIYAGDETTELELIKAANEQEAAAKSVLDVEVTLEKGQTLTK